jgi:hypothetical protein
MTRAKQKINGSKFWSIHSGIPLLESFESDALEVITTLALTIKLLFTLDFLVLIPK